MKITAHIAQHLLDVYTGGNWTEVSVADALAGLSYTQASTVTAASPNSIAAIVHHLAYWNKVMISRIGGENPIVPEANGFDVGSLGNDVEWKKLIREMLVSASELAVATRDVPEETLELPIVAGGSSTYKNLQGSVEHVHYHLGQIVVIKKLLTGSSTF